MPINSHRETMSDFRLPTLLPLPTTLSSLSTDFGVSFTCSCFVSSYSCILCVRTAIGNPRGDENPFLLTMGILWFRVHQYWAETLYGSHTDDAFKEDEFIFNRARQFTIATYQHVVYNDWLPLFIPRMFRNTSGNLPPYDNTPGYSAYAGYNPAINPQIAHIFQSAAMRWGHTVVTPGVWRRQLV